jgi:type VI secretion system secreted protein Hcp
METRQKMTKVAVSILVLAGLLVFTLLAMADNFTSLAPPSPDVSEGYEMLAGMFVRFEGVDGESQNKDHIGWCNALSFSQGQGLPEGQIVVGGSAGTTQRGNVVFEDIVVIKELDKASPKLAEAVCNGNVFPRVEIHLTYADAGNVTYYAYELKNVQIVSYRIGGSGYSEHVPTEELSLSFEEIKVTYTEFDDGGRAKGNVEYEWRLEGGGIRLSGEGGI